MDRTIQSGRPSGIFWDSSSSSSSDTDSDSDTDSELQSLESLSNRSTPTGARSFFDEPLDPESDATRDEMDRVRGFIDPSTYIGCNPKKAKSLRRRALERMVPGYNYDDQRTHECAVKLIKNGGRWVVPVFRFAESSGPFINFVHLTAPNGSGGWHFCDRADEGTVITGITPNPETGVFTGWFNHNGTRKFSSFFPEGVAPSHLIDFFSKTRPVYRRDNRALFFYENEGHPSFYVQVYYREGELVIHSAFPILATFVYSNDFRVEINGAIITEMAIMSLVDPDIMEEALEFETPDGVVVDLAKWNKVPGVSSGLYMYVRKADILKYEF